MHNSGVRILSKVYDPNTRLMYLLQYCNGKANCNIENCVLLVSEGYKKSSGILQMRYGHPCYVSHSIVDGLSSQIPIKTHDPEALRPLYRDVKSL